MAGEVEILEAEAETAPEAEIEAEVGGAAGGLAGAPAMALLEALQSGGDPSQTLVKALAGETGANPQLEMLIKLVSRRRAGPE